MLERKFILSACSSCWFTGFVKQQNRICSNILILFIYEALIKLKQPNSAEEIQYTFDQNFSLTCKVKDLQIKKSS